MEGWCGILHSARCPHPPQQLGGESKNKFFVQKGSLLPPGSTSSTSAWRLWQPSSHAQCRGRRSFHLRPATIGQARNPCVTGWEKDSCRPNDLDRPGTRFIKKEKGSHGRPKYSDVRVKKSERGRESEELSPALRDQRPNARRLLTMPICCNRNRKSCLVAHQSVPTVDPTFVEPLRKRLVRAVRSD